MNVNVYYLPVLYPPFGPESIKAWQEGPLAREFGSAATEYEIRVRIDRLTDELGRELRPTEITCLFGRWFDDRGLPSVKAQLRMKSAAAIRWFGKSLVEAADALDKGERVSLCSPLFLED